MQNDYGFDFEGFIDGIKPFYDRVKGLPGELSGFGVSYLDALSAQIMVEAFNGTIGDIELVTPYKDKLNAVMEYLGGQQFLEDYLLKWESARKALSVYNAPFELAKEISLKIEEMKGLNDVDSCRDFMDNHLVGKIGSSVERHKKN